MNKKQKKMLTRIIIAAVLMIAFKVISTFVDIPTIVLFIMYMVPYFVIGYDILRKAIKGILNRQVFDENFLMAVATVGAIIIALEMMVILQKQLRLCSFIRLVSCSRILQLERAVRT